MDTRRSQGWGGGPSWRSFIELSEVPDQVEYVVGPPGSGAEFNSIQAAIDAAVADGHNDADPATVRVLAGNYTEDVSMAAGIGVFGTAASVLIGTVTVDLVDQGSLDTTVTVWRQVTIAPSASGAPGIRATGTTAQQARFIECQVIPTDGDGVVVENTGSFLGEPSFTALVQCNVNVPAPGRVGLRMTAGSAFLVLGQIEMDDSSEVAVEVTGGSFMLALSSSLRGRVELSGPVVFLARRVNSEVTGGAAFMVTAPALCLLEGTTLINSDTSPAVDGTGVVVRDLISYTNPGNGVAATLTDILSLVDQSTNLSYTPAVPGNWVAPVPTNVADAIERMAAVVAGAHGPIP